MKQTDESKMTIIEAWKDLTPKERLTALGAAGVVAAILGGGIGLGFMANEQAHIRSENTLQLPDPIDDQHIDHELDGPKAPDNYVDPASIQLPTLPAPIQK